MSWRLPPIPSPDRWVYDDGGREAAGFPVDPADPTGDCVTRAIAIATGLGYRQVHELVDGLGYSAQLWNKYPITHSGADDGADIRIVPRILEDDLG